MYKPSLVQKAAIVLAGLAVASCSSSTSDGQGVPGTSGDFVVLRTTPSDNGQLFLNEPIAIDFSNQINLDSADFTALSFAVFDLNGKQLSEPVEGRFALGTSTGDVAVRDLDTAEVMAGRRLLFKPKFPLTDTYDDGGFRPGRGSIVQLVKGDHRRNVGLLDAGGRGLEDAVSFKFKTADGTTPSQLFKDTKVGGPRKTLFGVSPMNKQTGKVELNQLGQVATEIRLSFDQPLNPHSANVPFKIDLDPRTRSANERGRIYLEYDDPDGDDTWIPAEVELEENDLERSVVVLRPFGLLPNNAKIRVIVEATLEDMSGESNVNDAAYNRVIGEFETDDSYDLAFDAMVENFVDQRNFDLTAGFVEPLAEIVPGAIRANFDFEGGRTNLNYAPNTQEVVLDTDFTQILPSNGQPINVSNGVFTFAEVTIPAGVTVRGVGSNPMVWLVTGDGTPEHPGNFTVAGKLLVEGGQGQRVDVLNSANFPSGGGVGNCGGGNGGQASQDTSGRTRVGERGFGPGQEPLAGGGGGQLSCTTACANGSGGGGGSYVTQGDPYYKANPTQQFVQVSGFGGFGCLSRTSQVLPGGEPGPLAFKDPRPDNNFWGSAVDVFRGLRITGELTKPQGGQGGGGGGDYSANNCTVPDRRNFANDEKGGGGGAGGGVLVIKALGTIFVKRSGKISVAGGNGGGGAWAGSCNRAGGGGAGSGGMMVLMAGKAIEIEQHGATYAENGQQGQYNFALSADGGVGLIDVYGANSGNLRSKYDPQPHIGNPGANINARPSGGFGGLGMIQLMAPPGPNPGENDGTNTVLDDNIHIMVPGTTTRVVGTDKQRYLAWRGTADQNGILRNDDGDQITIGKAEGDMRPSPMLLPAPIGTRSRIRSVWIDLGAADRRKTILGGDGQPRGISQAGVFTPGESFGPRPEFAALQGGDMQAEPLAGYVAVKDAPLSGVEIDYPTVAGATSVDVKTIRNKAFDASSNAPGQYFRGHKNYIEVKLSAPNDALKALAGRFSHHFVKFTENGAPLQGEFRILDHDDQTLYVIAEGGAAVPDKTGSARINLKLAVTKKFFSIFTNGVEGFPQSFIGKDPTPKGVLVPRANIRIGFAFHQDPKGKSDHLIYPDARFPKVDPLNPRKPTFFADWGNQKLLDDLHAGGFRFVKYDILFNTQYQEDTTRPNNQPLGPDTPRPELRRLVLPYRY